MGRGRRPRFINVATPAAVATSLTVIYDSARRSSCAPPAPAKPRSAAARPRSLPRPARWPPPAARRRLRDPVSAARRPPPPAGSGGPSSMVHGQSELRRPGLLPSRGLFDRPKRQAPAAHRQKQCVSTASLHKVHLRGRAERGFGRSRVSWRSAATACRLIRSGCAKSRAPAPAKVQRVWGAAHLVRWMPQTRRFPSVAITCRDPASRRQV